MTSRPTKFELRSDTYSEYNFLAEFYDKHWGDFYEGLYPLIKKHYDEFAFPDEKILDICCGTGQFIRKLWNEGYNVTGLDGSEEMINVAKVNNPNVEFLVKDIRDFNFPNEYKMITCLFDSINHITKNEELLIVFKNVYNSLTEGGKFIFDVNTYRNFNDYWNNEFEIIEDQYRISIKTKFPVKPDIASMNIKVLSLQNDTILKENTILERCYETSEIKQMLLKCGFKSVNSLEDNSGRYIFIADI
nr:class I SAM-dependent methyltransferase [Jeotgalibacillus terrae]